VRVGGERCLAAPGSAPRRALVSLWEGGGGRGGWAARPREPVVRGVGAPSGSTRKRNKKHHLPSNALNQGSPTWAAGLRTGECFSVHYVTFFVQGGLRFMSRKPFLSILRECRGAPLSKMRISILYYIGRFAVWRGVEYGLVHAISPCTGGVRRQFENCGSRPQYRKSACAPLSRRCGRDAYCGRGTFFVCESCPFRPEVLPKVPIVSTALLSRIVPASQRRHCSC